MDALPAFFRRILRVCQQVSLMENTCTTMNTRFVVVSTLEIDFEQLN